MAEARFELWQEAEAEAIRKLRPEKWSRWRDKQQHVWEDAASCGDAISHTLNEAHKTYRDQQWVYTRDDGRPVIFASVAGRLVDAVDKNKVLWRAAAALDPTHVAGVVLS